MRVSWVEFVLEALEALYNGEKYQAMSSSGWKIKYCLIIKANTLEYTFSGAVVLQTFMEVNKKTFFTNIFLSRWNVNNRDGAWNKKAFECNLERNENETVKKWE